MTSASEQYTIVGDQPRAQLNTGHSIPLVGLGTWKAAKGEVKQAVIAAVRAGYRHIDCAAIYGNEHEVGEALAQLWAEGVVRREDIFVTSKLWNSEHAPERVEGALRKTLADLGLEWLDLYLIHWPSSAVPGPTVTPPLIDTWRAMEGLVDKGLVRSIGVSNFSAPKLQGLLDQARIKPAVNQVEAHPYWRNGALLAWCRARGIHVTAYSPLGSPDSAAIMQRDASIEGPLKDAAVADVGARLGRNAGQVLIRWGVQRGTSVLPKSVKPERIASNLDVVSWSLPEPDFQRISTLATQVRMVAGTFLLTPQGPYKTLEDLWEEEATAKM
mmetsp:Transcript_33914/g.85837  ORF Transcript_33914/g.85837 Transcript_33914/m.85837 type:complete len:328 (-) Transcript_33914:297-1280(-)